VAEKNIAEEDGEALCLASKRKTPDETIITLRCSVASGLEDYYLMMEGNKSLLAERYSLHESSEDLESKLTKARASSVEKNAALEIRIRSAEANAMGVVATDEKRFCDFEKELLKDLAELRTLYEHVDVLSTGKLYGG
jgi:hypothetical protein